ncbi:uncharacterized protein EI90DRAFT_3020341 [Cantharellus anzutake]|uniref:uncharacterized protein n=1 Tax=Cantharellus anzutake TaxID=1750568 RepID=UPI001906B7A9|nr:uncharacterized protein EI90DRAFT_3020341 [Cantharellus anzutake]KAF8321080.1 hypothetical protein EI90DRAFT_3020341 [Cantharellus anzutake]
MGQAYTREGSQPVFGSNSRRGGWYKSLEDGFENRSSTAGLSAGSVTRLAIYKAPEGFCVMIVSFREFSGNNRRGTRNLGVRQIPPRMLEPTGGKAQRYGLQSLAGNTLIVGLYDSTGSQPAYHVSKYQISEDSTFQPATQEGYHAGRPTPRTPSSFFKRQADGQFKVSIADPPSHHYRDLWGMGKDREGLFGDT